LTNVSDEGLTNLRTGCLWWPSLVKRALTRVERRAEIMTV